MQNLFYDRLTTRVFDLKGSARSRYVRVDEPGDGEASEESDRAKAQARVLLDDNFMESV
jgi:hypothetical protein